MALLHKKDEEQEATDSILGGKIEETAVEAKPEKPVEREISETERQNRKTGKGILIGLIAMVGVVALILVVGFFWNPIVTFVTGKDPQAKVEMTGSGHFYDTESTPEMSADGLKAVVTEAYYTKDGSLAVKLNLSNGLEKNQHLEAVSVTVYDENEKTIASGKVVDLPKDYTVTSASYNDLLVYITPKYVKIADDDLGAIQYSVTTECSDAK